MILSFASCSEGVDESEKRALADKFMESFATGNYGQMMNMTMTSAMSNQLSVEMLEMIWDDTLIVSFGKYLSYEGYLTQTENGGMVMYMYTLKFEGYDVIMAVGVNKKGEIASFTVAQAVSTASAEFSQGITEEKVTFGTSPYIIEGSVIKKEGLQNSPAAIILAGSGAIDRYGKVGANAIYANLADELAQNGITVLIFDKRTYTYASSITEAELMNFTIEDEYLYDAKAAYEFIKGYDGVDSENIFFIGHSLGGYILPMLDGYLEEDPEGYVFLSAPSDSMEELIVYQMEYIANVDGEISDDEAAQIEIYRQQVENVRNLTEENQGNYSYMDLINSPPAYWLSMKNYDSAARSAEITGKMFFAFGGKDYQVPEYQKDKYETALEGRDDVTIKLYDNMTHQLFDTDSKNPSPEDYNVKSETNEELVRDISDFILN